MKIRESSHKESVMAAFQKNKAGEKCRKVLGFGEWGEDF